MSGDRRVPVDEQDDFGGAVVLVGMAYVTCLALAFLIALAAKAKGLL